MGFLLHFVLYEIVLIVSDGLNIAILIKEVSKCNLYL